MSAARLNTMLLNFRTGCRFAAMYAIASYDTEIPTLPDSFSEAARDFVARCLIRLISTFLLLTVE